MSFSFLVTIGIDGLLVIYELKNPIMLASGYFQKGEYKAEVALTRFIFTIDRQR
jgi:dihydroorotate dehydrogenase